MARKKFCLICVLRSVPGFCHSNEKLPSSCTLIKNEAVEFSGVRPNGTQLTVARSVNQNTQTTTSKPVCRWSFNSSTFIKVQSNSKKLMIGTCVLAKSVTNFIATFSILYNFARIICNMHSTRSYKHLLYHCRKYSAEVDLLKGFRYEIVAYHYGTTYSTGFFRLGVKFPDATEVKPIPKAYLRRSMGN